MAGEIAIFLRNGPHSSATIRYALKVEDFSIQIAKTPVQIPVTRNDPELIDIGFYRPSITVSGIVDNLGGNLSNTTAGFEGMASITLSSRDAPNASASSQVYYIPYKNKLENTAYEWLYSDDTLLELEIADANRPVYYGGSHSTGGGVYEVAVQQARFQKNATREDRWMFTMQFVSKARKDVFA